MSLFVLTILPLLYNLTLLQETINPISIRNNNMTQQELGTYTLTSPNSLLFQSKKKMLITNKPMHTGGKKEGVSSVRNLGSPETIKSANSKLNCTSLQ
jgi:hypothetical protein